MKRIYPLSLIVLLFLNHSAYVLADEQAEFIQTPYTEQKVVFDFYFDEPAKIASALYWLRTLVKTLSDEPYNIATDNNDIKVIIHGTEIVTLAKKNYDKYKDVVERMRYYTEFGVEFKVCGLAAKDYDYDIKDFYEFVDLVPSSITELAHWQLQGYALIVPIISYKKHAIEDIR